MRLTVLLDQDTAAAIQEIQRELGIGVSEAINLLIRRGIKAYPPSDRFVQRSENLGDMVEVSNITAAIEALEGPSSR